MITIIIIIIEKPALEPAAWLPSWLSGGLRRMCAHAWSSRFVSHHVLITHTHTSGVNRGQYLRRVV